MQPQMTGEFLRSHLVCRLRFKQLALLAALDEHRNLHRAAAAVHLAQPSATKLVRDLERTIGFPIFERLPRGMHPTALGAEVLSFAKRALAGLERFTDDLQSRRGGGAGELVIGVVTDAAPDVVARAVSELKTQQPLLSIKLRGEANAEILHRLLDGKIDLAVGRFDCAAQHNLIDFDPLAPEVLHVVVRTGHPLARVPTLCWPMLQSSAWVAQSLTDGAGQAVNREFLRVGAAPPTNVIECSSISTTLQLLQASDAVTLLPEPVVRDHQAAGLLIRLPIEVGAKSSLVGILSRRGESFSAAATKFIELIKGAPGVAEPHRAPRAEFPRRRNSGNAVSAASPPALT
jgi:DNA-binding transcriptional LysR family regulator